MIDKHGHNLIFILSTPRSGSTLLSALLGSHSQAFSPPEPWLLLGLNAIYSKDAMIVSNYDHDLARAALHDLMDEKCFNEAVNSFVLKVYNSYLKKTGKKYFIDKTPRYYHILPWLGQIFPFSQKIWIKRNPLDVIASVKKTWGYAINEQLGDILSPISFDATIGYLKLASYFEEDDSEKITIRYEDLVKDPVSCIQSLCGFADVPFEEEMMNYGSNRELLQMYKERQMGDKKILEHQWPHTFSVGRWLEILTKEEIQKVLQTFGRELFNRLGYGSLVDEAAAFIGIDPAGIDEKGRLEQLMAKYPSYVDQGMLTMGAIQHSLIARQNAYLHSCLANSQNENAVHQQQLEAPRQELLAQERTVQQLEKELDVSRAAHTNQSTTIEELGQKVDQKEASLQQLKEALASSESQLSGHQTTEEELKCQLTERDNALEQVQAELATSQEDCSTQLTTIRVLREQVAEKENSLEGLRQDLTSFESQFSGLKRAKTTLKGQLTKRNNALDQVKHDLQAAESKCATKEKIAEDLKARIQKQEFELQQIRKLSVAQSDGSNQENTFENVKRQLLEKDNKLEQLKQKIAVSEETFSSQENTLENLNRQLTDGESTIGRLEQALTISEANHSHNEINKDNTTA